MSAESDNSKLALVEGTSVSLTGRGMELIAQELKAEVQDLPVMPLSLALKTILEAEAASVWAIAIWVTQRRLLARAVLFEMSEHPLVGNTVEMPLEGEPDEFSLTLIVQSAKDNLTRTYGMHRS